MHDYIFACDAKNYISRQAEFRGPHKQEYYEGDYQILPGSHSHVDVRIEKGLSCAFPILNLRTRSELRFRRSWNHIRSDKTDVSIIWFVRRGRLAISDQSGRTVVASGECTITRSLQPFYMENLVDEASVNEVLHVVVPTHILRDYVPDSVSSGTPFSWRDGDCRVAERTLSMLYEEGKNVDRGVAEDLIRAAFGAMGHSMAKSTRPSGPKNLGAKRLADILDCIQTHLANSDLTASAVARTCGVSTRYLCYLLSSQNTCFSELLWNTRLDRTKIWLAADTMRHVSIAEIAYMAGFKSPAHFSRMFKRVTQTTPRDYRQSSVDATDSARELPAARRLPGIYSS
jgi:AraC family transcriptional regulator, positive regulator of tynA and feaB